MNIITFKFKLWTNRLFWQSKCGRALTLKVFDAYKNSILFEERCKHFGTIGSSKMFSWDEFKHFRDEVWKDKRTRFTIWFKPSIILKELREKDTVLKGNVKFGSVV